MSSANDDLNHSYQPSPPREEIVQTAMKFLTNPNVVHTPLAQKQKFLQRKGLTDQEIQIACERADAYIQQRFPQSSSVPYTPQLQVTLFHRIRELVHNAAVFSIVAYAIYKFYERYIKPFLFGIKRKSVEDSIEELNTSVTSSVGEIKESLRSVRVDVDRIMHGDGTHFHRQLEVLQNDIATVKGLLLSRKQFPSVSNSPVVPQSIPAWQLSSVQAEPESDPKSEELMDMCSGSSDPEHATKTSDSSLEIIPCCDSN